MKKTGQYLLYGGALFFVIALIYINVSPDKKTMVGDSGAQKNSKKVEAQKTKPAEKVQVYVFHSTNRCYSCVTIGKYSRETIEEFFQPELRDGKIEFKEINIDLPENKELATKFNAVGSSLFINAIIDGKDNIKESTQVWRLVSNKQKFSSYLSEELKKIL